jgi:hypothetical protein
MENVKSFFSRPSKSSSNLANYTINVNNNSSNSKLSQRKMSFSGNSNCSENNLNATRKLSETEKNIIDNHLLPLKTQYQIESKSKVHQER